MSIAIRPITLAETKAESIYLVVRKTNAEVDGKISSQQLLVEWPANSTLVRDKNGEIQIASLIELGATIEKLVDIVGNLKSAAFVDASTFESSGKAQNLFNSESKTRSDAIIDLGKRLETVAESLTKTIPSDREIRTNSPLTGGGKLSETLNLSIAPVDSVNPGTMTSLDKEKLDSLPSNFPDRFLELRHELANQSNRIAKLENL